jgi:hypothetical protein
MTPHIPEQLSTRLIDWRSVVIMGNKIPSRDPDEDEDEVENEDEDEDEDEDDRADEPPVPITSIIAAPRSAKQLLTAGSLHPGESKLS